MNNQIQMYVNTGDKLHYERRVCKRQSLSLTDIFIHEFIYLFKQECSKNPLFML